MEYDFPWAPGEGQQDVKVQGASGVSSVRFEIPRTATNDMVESIKVAASRNLGNSAAKIKLSKTKGEVQPEMLEPPHTNLYREINPGVSCSWNAGDTTGKVPFARGEVWYLNVECAEEVHASLTVKD